MIVSPMNGHHVSLLNCIRVKVLPFYWKNTANGECSWNSFGMAGDRIVSAREPSLLSVDPCTLQCVYRRGRKQFPKISNFDTTPSSAAPSGFPDHWVSQRRIPGLLSSLRLSTLLRFVWRAKVMWESSIRKLSMEVLHYSLIVWKVGCASNRTQDHLLRINHFSFRLVDYWIPK